VFVVADEERSEVRPAAGRVGQAADHEFASLGGAHHVQYIEELREQLDAVNRTL